MFTTREPAENCRLPDANGSSALPSTEMVEAVIDTVLGGTEAAMRWKARTLFVVSYVEVCSWMCVPALDEEALTNHATDAGSTGLWLAPKLRPRKHVVVIGQDLPVKVVFTTVQARVFVLISAGSPDSPGRKSKVPDQVPERRAMFCSTFPFAAHFLLDVVKAFGLVSFIDMCPKGPMPVDVAIVEGNRSVGSVENASLGSEKKDHW